MTSTLAKQATLLPLYNLNATEAWTHYRRRGSCQQEQPSRQPMPYLGPMEPKQMCYSGSELAPGWPERVLAILGFNN